MALKNVKVIMLLTLCTCTLSGPVTFAYGSEGPGDEENIAAELAQDNPVSISVSPELKSRLAKFSSVEARQVKLAMDAGNRFMQQYMDGFVCGWDTPDWDIQIAPYVDDSRHIQNLCMKLQKRTNPLRLICPNATLIDIKHVHDEMQLTYQLVEVGKLNADNKFPVVTDFDTTQAGQFVQTTISINSRGMASNILPDGGMAETMYSAMIYNIFPRGKAADQFVGGLHARIYTRACGSNAH